MKPIAKKIPHEFELHGTKIQDNYAWLRAEGWPSSVTDKQVLSYLEEENKLDISLSENKCSFSESKKEECNHLKPISIKKF